MAKRKHKKGNKKGFKPPKYRKNNKPQQATAANVQKKQTMAQNQPTPVYGVKEGKATLVFNATDTLFFRESRPMESMGELQSVFPPSAQTLAGAIRTFIGDSRGVDWNSFGEDHELTQIIGFGDDLGALDFQGAWLADNGERLYPAPLVLMKKEENLHRLTLSDKGIWCDLGKKVRLPELPEAAIGSKPLENTWLTASGLKAVLDGGLPDKNSIKTANKLFASESRIGIARNNSTRTVMDGMLYQTEHIRPKQGLSIEMDAAGLPDDLPDSVIIRLGGEGRSASLSVQQKSAQLPKSSEINNDALQGLLLYLLTPLKHAQVGNEWQPLPGFTKQETADQTLWTGELNGVELHLHSAVTGKASRDGGWDLVKHQPRTANSLIPAGSVFFCSAKNGDHREAIRALHNSHIGDNSEYGLGHITTGIWLKNQ